MFRIVVGMNADIGRTMLSKLSSVNCQWPYTGKQTRLCIHAHQCSIHIQPAGSPRTSNTLEGIATGSKWQSRGRAYASQMHGNHYSSLKCSALAGPQPVTSSTDAEQASGIEWIKQLQPGMLIHATNLSSSQTGVDISAPLPSEVYLEVLQGWDAASQSCAVKTQGRVLRLSSSAQDPTQYELKQTGLLVTPSAAIVKSFPGWQAALTKQQSSLQTPLPWDYIPASSCRVVHSLSQLEQQVAQSPDQWCQGTAPGEALPTGVHHQVLNAGELLALMTGARGLVMVQLYAGWDASLPQVVFNPFVMTLLQRAVANKDLTITMSSIKGGLGVTALISTRKDPWKSWAKHMASFGAQAGLVAGSPYYQLLIGRMLGYKEENIRHYIKEQGGQLTPQIISAVETELAKLSNKKPTLPWNTSSRGKKK